MKKLASTPIFFICRVGKRLSQPAERDRLARAIAPISDEEKIALAPATAFVEA